MQSMERVSHLRKMIQRRGWQHVAGNVLKGWWSHIHGEGKVLASCLRDNVIPTLLFSSFMYVHKLSPLQIISIINSLRVYLVYSFIHANWVICHSINMNITLQGTDLSTSKDNA